LSLSITSAVDTPGTKLLLPFRSCCLLPTNCGKLASWGEKKKSAHSFPTIFHCPKKIKSKAPFYFDGSSGIPKKEGAEGIRSGHDNSWGVVLAVRRKECILCQVSKNSQFRWGNETFFF
jgi:hypothetical protein